MKDGAAQAMELLPRNLEAEKAVLGSMAMSREARERAVCELKPTAFFDGTHRQLFQAMAEAHRAGVRPDFTFLSEYLEKRHVKDAERIINVFAQVAAEVSTAAGVDYHLQLVKEYDQRRGVLGLLENAQARALRGEPAEVIRDIRVGLEDLDGGGGRLTGPKPLSIEEVSAAPFLDHEPPEPRFLFKDLLMEGVVGALIGLGGSSKSFLLLVLILSAAIGQSIVRGFEPTRAFRVLALFAEDPAEILHARLYHILQRFFPNLPEEIRCKILENLHIASVRGRLGPLMELQDGNPRKAEGWYCLRSTIENLGGADLLTMDPKSRIYGLDELNNDHNTAFVAGLEELAEYFGMTVLFTHHANKRSAGALDQGSSRGGSALVDACRWVANVRQVDEKTAKRFKIDSPREFIEFDITKTNYAPPLRQTFYFKRSDHGVVVPANLHFGRIRNAAKSLCDLLTDLGQDGSRFSRRDLRERAGKEIREELGITTREMMDAVDHALEMGWLKSVTASGFGKGRREVLEATVEG